MATKRAPKRTVIKPERLQGRSNYNDDGKRLETVTRVVNPPLNVTINEARMQDRPQGITVAQWRARLLYQAVQEQQAGNPAHLTRNDNYDALSTAAVALREAESA